MSNNVFRFTLNHANLGIMQISEPDGWSDCKLKMERHPEFHSLVEYFEGSFVFYGENNVDNGGADFIRQCENLYGPDAEIGILIELVTNAPLPSPTAVAMPDLSDWSTRSTSDALYDWTTGAAPTVHLPSGGFPNTAISEILYVPYRFKAGCEYVITLNYTKTVNTSHSNPRTLYFGVYNNDFVEIFSTSDTMPSTTNPDSVTFTFTATSDCKKLGVYCEEGSDVDITLDSISATVSSDDYIIFAGMMDLTGLKEMQDNKISVPIIRNDLWAKFIARKGMPVNLRSTTTVDGEPIRPGEPIDINLTSQKVLQQYHGYINDLGVSYSEFTNGIYYQISFDDEILLDELKERYTLPRLDNAELPAPNFVFEYGGSYVFDIRIIASTFTVFNAESVKNPTDFIDYFIQFNEETPIPFDFADETVGAGVHTVFTHRATHSLNANTSVRIYGQANTTSAKDLNILGGSSAGFSGTSEFASYCKIEGHTTFPSTTAQAFLIHDAASEIVARITG